MERRNFLATGLAASAAAVLPAASIAERRMQDGLKGIVNHSVCKWCYPDLSVSELAKAAAQIGLKSVELLGPEDWPAVRSEGLICAMANPSTPEGKNMLTDGFNQLDNHEWLIPRYIERIEEVADAGFPNLICFSGNRDGLDDRTGLDHCVRGLRQIASVAEQHGVTVCMELLNSRVDHPDYQCDRVKWGLELVDGVGSDRVKLLYDIYHMQIMEGDIIRTIRNHHDYFAHYHTGGNPGRNEIDQTQELNYRAIVEAIMETGFEGYIAQEFIPTRDPLTSLEQGVRICDV